MASNGSATSDFRRRRASRSLPAGADCPGTQRRPWGGVGSLAPCAAGGGNSATASPSDARATQEPPGSTLRPAGRLSSRGPAPVPDGEPGRNGLGRGDSPTVRRAARVSFAAAGGVGAVGVTSPLRAVPPAAERVTRAMAPGTDWTSLFAAPARRVRAKRASPAMQEEARVLAWPRGKGAGGFTFSADRFCRLGGDRPPPMAALNSHPIPRPTATPDTTAAPGQDDLRRLTPPRAKEVDLGVPIRDRGPREAQLRRALPKLVCSLRQPRGIDAEQRIERLNLDIEQLHQPDRHAARFW